MECFSGDANKGQCPAEHAAMGNAFVTSGAAVAVFTAVSAIGIAGFSAGHDRIGADIEEVPILKPNI